MKRRNWILIGYYVYIIIITFIFNVIDEKIISLDLVIKSIVSSTIQFILMCLIIKYVK